MTQDDFKQFTNALRFSYEVRRAADDQMDFWYSKAGHLPDECLEWLRDRIKMEHPDRFPKHFQDVLLRLFSEWRWSTGKATREPECPECDQGWVTTMEAEDMYPGKLIPVAYACNRCRPQLRGVKHLTKAIAKRQGLLLVDAKATAGEASDFSQGFDVIVAEMASKLGANYNVEASR